MKKILFTFFVLLFTLPAFAQQQYKVTLLRAAPGNLLELIEVIKEDITKHKTYGIEEPYLLRHSQGDHWDLMLIYPIEGTSTYFSDDKMEKRPSSNSLEQAYGNAFYDLVSFQEEAIVEGPNKEKFNDWFENYAYFHIEIFTALAGKQDDLLKQRQDENVFYDNINHRPNLIFTRVFGPSWDIFTVGAYKDLKDFACAGSPELSFEKENKAAKDAGFEGVNYIGSYLRSLLLKHHDTLANKAN